MPRFLIALYDDPESFGELSPEEMQAIVARYQAWAGGLHEAGRLVDSNKLVDGAGRVLRRREGRVSVSDGPFAETKELLGGYFLIEAATLDEAERLCADCPHLEHGTVEIRPVEVLSEP